MSLAISSLLPQPPNNTRADLLSLKQRLATLLPQEQGKLYWTSLGQFVTGKINREEWGRILKGVMSGLEGEGGELTLCELVRREEGLDCLLGWED